MDEDARRDFIRRSRWQFAKTMPDKPHEYTLRKWCDPGEFEDFVATVRREGYKDRYEGRTYTYLNVDGYRYWTMGASVRVTTVLNRARLDLVDAQEEKPVSNPKQEEDDGAWGTVLS